MTAAAILHSDHVNLLVFRYLQESGFESAAIALTKDWHRPPPFRDPEHLPFAHEVHRNELVTLIQTGLYHDELSQRVRKSGRRFRWSQIDARASIERQDEYQDGGADTRPSSSGRRKERPLVARSQDDFPTPVPKRQRRSEGSEPQVNGERDAMEVDAASADGEEEGDTASAGGASEPEVIERYDSMEVGTQTVIKTGPKTSTISWNIDKPGANLAHAIWNPSSKGTNRQTLMAVGDDLCRFYQVPESLSDTKQLTHVDDPSLPNESAVTAVTWHPDGQGACCAIDGLRDLPSTSKVSLQLLLEQRQDGTSISLQLGPNILEPPGVIFSVQYSPNGEYLLALRANTARSLVQVWRSSHCDTEDVSSPRDPLAWRLFDNEVTDVAWTTNDSFLVCGDNGLASLYQVDENQQNGTTSLPAGSIAIRGLISQNSSIFQGNTRWDKLRHDLRTGTTVFASPNERRMFITSRLRQNDSREERDAEIALPGGDSNLEALAFQPSKTEDTVPSDQGNSTFLAAAFDDGTCHMYNISCTAESGTSCTEATVLRLSDPPATVLAWSPDGSHLAVSSSDMVQIWKADSFIRKNGILLTPKPTVTWRSSSEIHYAAGGEYEADDHDVEPSVNWSADGESLVFASKRHISVIRFQDEPEAAVPQVNGHHDP